MVRSVNIVFASKFVGFPKETDFRFEEENLMEEILKKNEILIETICLSTDPYVRCFAGLMTCDQLLGSVVMGEVVASVLASNCDRFQVGETILAKSGWRTHAIVSGDDPGLRPYPLAGTGLPPSLALGAVGMPGATAYIGLLHILSPIPGDVVLVNAASGAVGSLVGQIAKIKGCVVVGLAGTDEKVDFLKTELGFHFAFNYRTNDLSAAIDAAAPEGVDCFFDNVGGDVAAIVYGKMKLNGRVCLCGRSSKYNEVEPEKVQDVSGPIIFKQLRVQGIAITSWPRDQWYEAFESLVQWIQEGKLKTREASVIGIERAPKHFVDQLRGAFIGKAIVNMK